MLRDLGVKDTVHANFALLMLQTNLNTLLIDDNGCS